MTAKIEFIKTNPHFCHTVNTTENTTDFKVVQLYVNTTNEDICVVHRNNLPIIVKHSNNFFGAGGSLIIRNVYHFNGREQIVSTINNLTSWKETSKIRDSELEIILNTLVSVFDNTGGNLNSYSVTVDKEVPLKVIKQHSMLYVNEADILICDPRSRFKCYHPYSEEGLLQDQYREFIEERKVSGVFIELIDNENSIKSRFMYAAKRLIEIPARQDKSKASGFYVTVADHDKLSETNLETKHYTFEEAESAVGAYRTAEEAETGGNPELLHKLEDNRTKIELAELKKRTDKERLASEEYILSLRDELEARKLTRADRFEDIKMERNDYYDNRSLTRKDNSEIYKIGAAVIATGLSVFALTSKYNSK